MKLVLLLISGIISISADEFPTVKIDNDVLEKVMVYAEKSRVLYEFAVGNNLFAVDLYKELMKTHASQSFVVSPLLAELTLALVHSGAAGKTAQELSIGLHQPNSKKSIKKAIKYLNPYLQNALYRFVYKIEVNQRYMDKIQDEFKSTAVDVFQSIISSNNFGNNIAAAAEINKWAEEKTNNKIKDLIHEDDLHENTCAMLLNAMYFNKVWEHTFPIAGTRLSPFYPDSYSEINIASMEQHNFLKYYYSKKLEARFIELPCEGDDITFTIVLPDYMGNLSVLENHLPEVLSQQKYEKHFVELLLPKFEIKSRIDFIPILRALGVVEAFSDNADFTEIIEKFKISKFIQKVAIKVEERGNRKSPYTLQTFRFYDPETGPSGKSVYVDHPFIFYVKIMDFVVLVGTYTGT